MHKRLQVYTKGSIADSLPSVLNNVTSGFYAGRRERRKDRDGSPSFIKISPMKEVRKEIPRLQEQNDIKNEFCDDKNPIFDTNDILDPNPISRITVSNLIRVRLTSEMS